MALRFLLFTVFIGLASLSSPLLGLAEPTSSSSSSAMTQTLTAGDAWKKIEAGAILIEVRSPKEFSSGHLKRAINISHTELKNKLNLLGSDKNREIVLYCRSGRRSGIAQEALIALGYTQVYNAGGYTGLANAENKS